MNKYLKYTLKGVAAILIILLVLYGIVLIYVTVNKQKIIKQVTQEISKKLSGNVTIGTVDISFFSHFPQLAVELHNVLITDTMYAVHHHPFFQAQSVFGRVSALNLITKGSFINGFRIDNGSFYLYTDTSGYTNRYLFNPKKDSSASSNKNGKNELKLIVLNNVRITEDNRKINKLHDIVVNKLEMKLDDKDQTSFLFSAKINMLVHSLAFNLERGSFIKEKTFSGDFDFKFDKISKQLQFDDIDVSIGGQAFNITARFDLAGNEPQFTLRTHTKNLLYSFGKSLLTHKIDSALSIVDIEKPLDINADLSGPLKGGDPLIKVTWSAKNTAMATPFIHFTNATFGGYYINEVTPGLPRKDPNSKIVITDFSASWNGLPFTSNRIEVLNLAVPVLTCDLKSSFALTKLNDLLGSNVLELRSGNGSANISYHGPLTKNDNTNSFINGNVSFSNGSILYTPTNVELKSVSGLLIFKNSDVFVQNLQCVALNNKIVMQGQALNLLTLMNSEPSRVNIDWSIYSPSLNLNPFTFLLQPRQKVTKAAGSNNKLIKFSTKIDQVLEQGSVNVNLKAVRLLYKKFDASNINANVSLLQDRYLLNDVSMDHAGGHMDVKGSLITVNNYHNAKLNVLLDNVDVNKVLTAFDNFGQDGITAQNLQGKLTAKIDASMAINNEGKAEPSSVESIVDFSLKNGSLNNYEPIKKLQNFIFKNRDFENIRFAELKDKLEIKNQEIKINRMEIQSSVMSMFVEGVYGPKKGSTDISIQVPLSNIHKRGVDYNPENIGTDKKTGSSIHVRGRPGPDGNIKFKLDLFNKYKKEAAKKLNATTNN